VVDQERGLPIEIHGTKSDVGVACPIVDDAISVTNDTGKRWIDLYSR
jgi:hypothetical protein